MHDYKILVHDGKQYRPVADITPTGQPIWASSNEDTLKWYGLTRQDLAKRKTRINKRFPRLKISVRRV